MMELEGSGRWSMENLHDGTVLEIVRRIDVEAKTLSSCSVCLTIFLLGFMIWYDSL